jgi:hypothetical protein
LELGRSRSWIREQDHIGKWKKKILGIECQYFLKTLKSQVLAEHIFSW